MLPAVTLGSFSLPAVIGFGSYTTLDTIPGITIDMTSEVTEISFMVPMNGTLDSMMLTFRVTDNITLIGGEISVYAQVYVAPQDSVIYTAIPETLTQLLPTITSSISAGTLLTANLEDLGINIAQGSKVMLIIFSEGDAVGPSVVTGLLTGALSITI